MHTPSGPYLCLYQILSEYFKPLRSYRVHKNLASESVQGRYLEKEQGKVILLVSDIPTWSDICLYPILSTYLKQYRSSGLHKISASGEMTT